MTTARIEPDWTTIEDDADDFEAFQRWIIASREALSQAQADELEITNIFRS